MHLPGVRPSVRLCVRPVVGYTSKRCCCWPDGREISRESGGCPAARRSAANAGRVMLRSEDEHRLVCYSAPCVCLSASVSPKLHVHSSSN